MSQLQETKWVGTTMTGGKMEETPTDLILQLRNKPSQPITARMTLNWKQVLIEVDTGAAVSIMLESTQKSLFPEERPKKSNARLKTYTTEPLHVVGVIRVRVNYGEYSGMQTLYVVRGNEPTLLRCDWMQTI